MWWILLLPALLFLVTLTVFLLVFYVTWREKRQDPVTAIPQQARAQLEDACRQLVALPCEEIRIRSHDGLTLFGRYYPGQPGAPLHIQFHGYRSPAMRDFCGGHKLARERGHAILLVDQRGHGRSDGHVLTFGVRERLDCLAWAQYAAQRFPGTPLLLSGISMGAATVLMAGELPLPDAVVGIIADCPYTAPDAIIRHVCRWKHYPGPLLMPFIRLGAWLFGGFRLGHSDPVTAVKHTSVPILLIHGEADAFVPCDMSRAIAAACTGPVTLVTFPGAGHGGSYVIDTPRYEAAVDAFLRTVLPS